MSGETLLVTAKPISSFLVHLVMFLFLASERYDGWMEAASRGAVMVVVLALIFEVAEVLLPEQAFSKLDFAGNLVGVGLAWIFFRFC